jgi:hypothetical protein
MKILTGLMVVTLCSSLPAAAQLVMTKDASGKTRYSLFVPKTTVVNAATFVKKAELGLKMKMPAKVELNLLEQFITAKNMCPFLKAPKPSLELDGERRSNETVGLEWKTFNGGNNLGFDVERSFDDTFHFERVNYVWAKNVAGIKDKYELPDGNAYNKVSYYRLRLLLRSGEYLYSNIAKVGGFNKDALFAYPNPASGAISLNITADSKGAAAVRIFDGTGRAVWQQISFMNDGSNVRTISLNNLSAGAYTIMVDMNDRTARTIKFLKQ